MPQPVDPRVLGVTVVGGAAGVFARAIVLAPVTDPAAAPWVTLGINVAGSLILGVVVGWLDDRRPLARAFLGTGVMGGFTTYSAFAVALALWLPLQRSRNRNRFFVALLLVLGAANLGFHLAHAGALPIGPQVPIRFALYLVVIIVTIMAGRVVPSFTQNAIPTARIRRNHPLDLAAIWATAVALGAALASAPAAVTVLLCFAATLQHVSSRENS